MRRKAFVCSTAMWTAAGLGDAAEFPPLVAAAAAVQTLRIAASQSGESGASMHSPTRAAKAFWCGRRIEPSSLPVYTKASSACPGRCAARSVAAKASSTVASPRFASLRMTRATASASCTPTGCDGSGCDKRVISAVRSELWSPSRLAPRRQWRTASFFSVVAPSSRAASGRPDNGLEAASSASQNALDCEASFR